MKREKKRKKRVILDHEQKRRVAKQIVQGRHVKQVAADWGISLDSAHKIAQEYLIVLRIEKYPVDSVQQGAYRSASTQVLESKHHEDIRNNSAPNADSHPATAGAGL